MFYTKSVIAIKFLMEMLQHIRICDKIFVTILTLMVKDKTLSHFKVSKL